MKLEAELAELGRVATEEGNEHALVLDGRWKLLSRLGKGGVAEVWLGLDQQSEHPRSGKPALVAVKLLRAALVDDQVILTRFIQGALRAQSIAHSAITRVIEKPRHANGRHFYIMEFVNAPTLETWSLRKELPSSSSIAPLQQGSPDYSDALWDIISTVGEGLAALHKAGLVHGDIKPSNILVDDKGNVKLCDFDLVHYETSREAQVDPFGTIPFIAPEVRAGSASTPLSDQFSLAMTLVAILLGANPPEPARVVESPELLKYPVARRICLDRALSVDPQRRYETIEGLISSLGPENFRSSGR